MATFFSARATWRRLLGALAVGVVSALTHPALATKPTPAPPPSSFDHPAVQFVEPKPGAKLSGAVPVKVALGSVDQITRFELGLEGDLSPVALGWNLFLPTRDKPNGRRALIARATYRSGQVIEARVLVDIYNPSQRLELINPITREVTKGTTAILELTYSEPVRIEADFGDLDSAFDATRVKVANAGGNVYRVSYPISAGSTRAEGRHRVVLRARNRAGEVVEDAFELELRQNPLLPIVVSRSVYTHEVLGAMLVDRVGEPDPDVRISPGAAGKVAHGLEIKALPDLIVGRVSHARVLWKAARSQDAQRPKEPRLVVKARGYSGYYLCRIPEGATSGHIELSLPAPGTYGSNLDEGDRIPDDVELMVAVETEGIATEWVTHRFMVRPAGWQRPLTSSAEAGRKRKIKRALPSTP